MAEKNYAAGNDYGVKKAPNKPTDQPKPTVKKGGDLRIKKGGK
jgi:hypothetical protein